MQPFQCWHMDFVGPYGLCRSLTELLVEISLSFLLQILSGSGSRLFHYPTKPLKYCCGKLFVDMVFLRFYSQTKVKTLNQNYYRNSTPTWILEVVAHHIAPSVMVKYSTVQRMNRNLAERLATEIGVEDQTDWDEKLSIALAAIRTTSSTTTGETPFSVIFGFNCRNKADMVGIGKVHQLKGKAAQYYPEKLSSFSQLYTEVRNWVIKKRYYYVKETFVLVNLRLGRKCGSKKTKRICQEISQGKFSASV
mgnify:CR=1 FL=1